MSFKHGFHGVDGSCQALRLLASTYHYSPISSRITRDRFFELHRYLHFVDNSSLAPPGSPNDNKLGKVQPIIRQSFQSVYSHSKNVSVDEAMIPFKGRSSLKQYMPQKPVKREA